MTIMPLFSGILLYLFICTISVLAGLGMVRLLRLDIGTNLALLLAPQLTVIFWAIGLGIGVGLRVPVYYLAFAIWPFTIALALVGLWGILYRIPAQKSPPTLGLVARPAMVREQGSPARLQTLALAAWPLALAMLIPIVVMLPFFRAGLINYNPGPSSEHWSYIAYGQYLWQNPRGADGGLAPLHQYAAHTSKTRYISSSLLGLLSVPLAAGDTQLASSLFLAWCLFLLVASCALFGRTRQLRSSQLLMFLLLTGMSGWSYTLILIGNYDNALALAFFPALMALIACIKPGSWQWIVVLGCMLAALLYIYPELSAIILGCTFIVAAIRVWHERSQLAAWLLTAGCAVGIALILLGPFSGELLEFIQGQLRAGGLQPGARAGEGAFKGLLDWHYQPTAFWGLGGEFANAIDGWMRFRKLLAALLSLLAAAGLVRMLWRRELGLAIVTLLLLAATLTMIIQQAYSYGAYKIILMGWWVWCFTLVRGIETPVPWLSPRLHGWLTTGIVTLLITCVLVLAPSSARWNRDQVSDMTSQLGMDQFRALQGLSAITGDAGIQLQVSDPFANQWAVYFLRNLPITIKEYRSYMAQAHVIPFMQRARPLTLEQIQYSLTDANFAVPKSWNWQPIWSNTVYQLWNLPREKQITVLSVDNPNGLEQVDGKPFFWVGQQPARLQLYLPSDGQLTLSSKIRMGASLPGVNTRQVLVESSQGYRNTISQTSGQQIIILPVQKGTVMITMTVLDLPTVSLMPHGEPRTLLMGVYDLTLGMLDPSQVTVTAVDNPNGVEELDGESFFWMGKDPVKISLFAPRDGRMLLSGVFLMGGSLPELNTRRLQIDDGNRFHKIITITSGTQTITLPVIQGQTILTLTVLDAPTVLSLSSGDTRTLMLGVKGLHASLLAP